MKIPSRDEATPSHILNQQGNRKKRRRCGVCSPCLTKLNCESCSNCLNRKTGHQICKYRKCIELRKKNATLETDQSQQPQAKADHEGTPEKTLPSEDASDESVRDSSTPKRAFTENPSTSPHIASFPEVTANANPTLQDDTSSTPIEVAPPSKDAVNAEPLDCSCRAKDESVAYTQLGVGSSIADVHSMLAKRFNIELTSIRIEQVRRSIKEAKTPEGCPVARWVLRRSNNEEKVLSIVKQRCGHTCNMAVVVLCIVLWEGIPEKQADCLYTELSDTLNEHATPTIRRCGANESKLCACQGTDSNTSGASFSFGCAWNMYFNGCKFAKSKTPRKFRLQNSEKEDFIDRLLQDVATQVADKYKTISPVAFQNQTRHNEEGGECRLGTTSDAKPFSSVTCCVDFCAHNHKDKQNMDDGATVVLSLLGENARNNKNCDNEQLHSLPWYQLLDANQNVLPPNYVIPKHILKSPSRPKPQTEKTPTNVATNGIQSHHLTNTGFQTPLRETPEYNNNPGYPMSGYQTAGYQTPDKHYRLWNDAPGFDPYGVSPMESTPGFSPGYEHPNGVTYPSYLVNGFKNMAFRTQNGFRHENGVDAPANVSNENSDGDEVTWLDDAMGGVGIALTHGSILVECAKIEVHATTSLRNPNRKSPSRLSLVFYQHKNLNKSNHGAEEYKKKMEQKKMEAAQLAEKNEGAAQFGIGSLEMLAETALKEHRTEQATAVQQPVEEPQAPLPSTSRGQFHPNDVPATHTSDNVAKPLSETQSYPLSEYLRSLKQKEAANNGFSLPPVVNRNPCVNGYFPPLPLYAPLMHATPAEYNPFTPAAGMIYSQPRVGTKMARNATESGNFEYSGKQSGQSKNTNGYTVEALLGKKREHEEPTRDHIHADAAVKQRKLELNGFPRYGNAMSGHFFGWPVVPDMAVNPNKFFRYDAFPPKAGTPTHAIDTLVSMAPYARPFMAANFPW